MTGKVWAVDGTNWCHVFWHTVGQRGVRLLPVLRDRLAKIYRQFSPAEIFVAWDTPGSSWRREVFPEYKATRSETPAELADQLRQCEHGIADLATPLGANGFEADDVLATVAAVVTQRGGKTVIASPDKDLRQCLVAGVVTICRNLRTDAHGKLVAETLTADTLLAGGLSPTQWVDFQALVGDTTDNVPGCPGVGEKTAKALLAKAGTIEQLCANPWKYFSSDRKRETFCAWVRTGQMAMARELVTLCREVPDVASAM